MMKKDIIQRVDRIITKALLVTSNQCPSDLGIIYGIRLKELIKDPVSRLIHDSRYKVNEASSGSEIESQFHDTALDGTHASGDCACAQECFICQSTVSEPVSHEDYSNQVGETSMSTEIDRHGDSRNIDSCFNCKFCRYPKRYGSNDIVRVETIIKRLAHYLEVFRYDDNELAIFVNRLLDDKKIRDCQKHRNTKKSHEIEEMNKQIEFNTKKSCVLICRTRQSELEDMKMCLNYLHIKMTEKELSESILSGYTVILYRSNQSACLAVRGSLVSFIEQLPHSRLNCRVIKVYTLFFIKLACVITRVIHDIIASNPNFCELISKMLICETTLYDTFFFRTLFIGIRKHIAFYIIAQIQKTEIGRYSFSIFVLSRLRLFYSSKLKGNCTKKYLIELESQTISSPSIFMYLVENGLLLKMIDFLTSCLETIGFTRNRSNGVVSLCTDNESIDYVCMNIKKATRLLHGNVTDVGISECLKSEIMASGSRLVDFCIELDSIEQNLRGYEDLTLHVAKSLYRLIRELHQSLQAIISLLVKCENAISNVLESFCTYFGLKDFMVTSVPQIPELIETLWINDNYQRVPHSVINISSRIFIEIVITGIINQCLSSRVKEFVFTNIIILIYTSRSSIRAISLRARNNLDSNLNYWVYLDEILSDVRRRTSIQFYYLQDFSALQILISYLDPDLFIKILMFYFIPTVSSLDIATKPSLSLLSGCENDDVITEVLILIYNALTERHVIGNLMIPETYIMERQILHLLAAKDRKLSEIRNRIDLNGITRQNCNSSTLSQLEFSLSKFEWVHVPGNCDEKYSVNDRYLDAVNPFYFLNSIEETMDIFDRLNTLYINGIYTFRLPPIIDLRPDFQRLNDFLFSYTYADMLLHTFFQWYTRPDSSFDNSEYLIIVIVMSLCLILKTSNESNIYDKYHRVINYLFGHHRQFGNRSILGLIHTETMSLRTPILESMIDYLIELSKDHKARSK